jgi:uncharacterized membrane protein YtjA (UPF0391 family)
MLEVGLACLVVAFLAGAVGIVGVGSAGQTIAWLLFAVFAVLAAMAFAAYGLRHLAATRFLWTLVRSEPDDREVAGDADRPDQPNSSVALCGRWSLGRDSRPLPGVSARSNASCSILAFRKAPQ